MQRPGLRRSKWQVLQNAAQSAARTEMSAIDIRRNPASRSPVQISQYLLTMTGNVSSTGR